ncbi:Cytochrome c [Polystyrenella longa]|uniref:Cytochrome c n=1 Tax=Polystyrenella longa TaxID=2528007 RepID=A0A518CH91_9PLAN|nr:c-type cytochrome [Polystyrenella longa]QDU78595.1 Cytochrome c [Polystyrenella longa]
MISFRQPFRFLIVLTLLFSVAALAGGQLHAQEDEDAVFLPGVLGSYQQEGAEVFERIDSDIAFDWGTQTPDDRLSADRFAIDWNSLILIRQKSPMQFHAYLRGEVEVKVDGIVVLNGKSNEPGWISGEVQELPLGEQEFEVHFAKTSDQAVIKLYWSSDAFALEPIPENALLREEPSRQPWLEEQGHMVADAFRCFNCHASSRSSLSSLDMSAPALQQVRDHVSWEWLVAKLQDPTHENIASKMPNYGFDKNEAEAVAAYLWSKSKPTELLELPELPQPKPDKKKDAAEEPVTVIDPIAEGERVANTVGCLACHQVGELGTVGHYSGPELTHLGSKRTAEWIYTWLEQPEKLHPNHRMPEVLLSKTEKTQVAQYLASLQPGDSENAASGPPEMTDAMIERGEKLIAQASCVSCHDLGKNDTFKPFEVAAIQPNQLNGEISCVGSEGKSNQGSHKPHFGERADGEALDAFLSIAEPAATDDNEELTASFHHSDYTEGERLLHKKNCLACHQRGNDNGLKDLAGKIAANVPGQEGLSEAFVPPSLNAIGDKLLDEVLAKAIAGQQDRVRLDWLAVRMPKFEHSQEESAALLTYLKGHDRIPAAAPATTPIPEVPKKSEEEWFLTGQALVGARGFSCIACHQIGDFQPKKVEPGTRGTDLQGIGDRMRKEFYFRWVQSPIRIIRGMEMPSFNRPKEGVLEAHLPSQLAAVWEALNDPRLTVPTDPSVVEQYWAVAPGEKPRVVRDVFMVQDQDQQIPLVRSFAAGFDNGHSLLYDLSQPQLRVWTVGDFARQRTAGKSWYWDLAGNQLAQFSSAPDFALSIKGDIQLPLMVDDSATRLISYQTTETEVVIEYLTHFQVEGKTVEVRVREQLETASTKANSNDSKTGLKRTFTVSQIPQGGRLLVSIPKIAPGLGNPQVELISNVPQEAISHGKLPTDKDTTESRTWVRLNSSAEEVTGSLLYQCDLKAPALVANLEQNTAVQPTPISTLPGFTGQRLSLPPSLMPTAMTVTASGDLAFTSLKGDVYLARDTDGDGFEDKVILVEEGLAAPFGIYADGDQLLVSHKPEVLRLVDTNGDGRADTREVVATGWGYSEDYHDWTCGIVKDSKGYYYIGIGSDYAQKKRLDNTRKWRGAVLRFDESGNVEPVGTNFRYPTGLAIDAQDRVYVSDQQGVQNTFNEINYLQPGKSYGVLSWQDRDKDLVDTRAAVQLPHPWTRSVNGLFILPEDYPIPELAGEGIGCEYNGRFLIRFNIDEINGEVQGGAYNFSQPDQLSSQENFLGPLSGCVGPDGTIYIGSMYDSGWSGGSNTGEIVKLKPTGSIPNGIKQIRSRKNQFEIEFMRPVDKSLAADPEQYGISTYTRVWQGAYGTPDSGRHQVEIEKVTVADDGKSVILHVPELLASYVYEINCGDLDTSNEEPFWPSTGNYTVNTLPE